MFLIFSVFSLLFTACSDDDGFSKKRIVKYFVVDLNNSNTIPMIVDRQEIGKVTMNLYDDNSLDFEIVVGNLSASDALTIAHVHKGDVVSNGSPLITLVDNNNISFSGNIAKGSLVLSPDEISSLNSDNIYINVHSKEKPSGLIRGQIGMSVSNAYDVALSSANEVPALEDRNETGMAYFRIVGSIMYYKLIVDNLYASDIISGAHIHKGSADVNGDLFINLNINNNDDLGLTKQIVLSDADLIKINKDVLYINIHSEQKASGLLRGQLR